MRGGKPIEKSLKKIKKTIDKSKKICYNIDNEREQTQQRKEENYEK